MGYEGVVVQSGNPFDAYVAWTDTVAKYPPTAEPFYLALGVADEFGELMDARSNEDKIKEAGDTCWYIGRYCNRVLSVPFSTLIDYAMQLRRGEQLSPCANIGIICGIEKKRIRDGEQWDLPKLSAKNQASYEALAKVMSIVIDILDDCECTILQCLRINMDKLGARLVAGTIQGDGDNR